jgi:wyosine [tRNA(Phe)-imidazoG37] synthetase (radical SAM superfamily)
MPRQYTYGPFKSRRLGLSLGVDILPRYKLCTFNCVYCEIGPTYQAVPPEYRIKAPPTIKYRKELKDILKFFPHLDSITFGYNGEPTLNENLLDFYNIAFEVRAETKWNGEKPKMAIFTNSSTMYSQEIRDRLIKFDLIVAKLDAALELDFLRTNRPHKKAIDINIIIDSLVELKKNMKESKLAIQCLIYNSYREDFISNDNNTNIEKLALAIKQIKPDIVQIYSIARIPAQNFVYSIDAERKKEIVKIFKEIVDDEEIKIEYY